MSTTYDINEFDKVVPYVSGRKCSDTKAWRDATELELEQRDKIAELEAENQLLNHAIQTVGGATIAELEAELGKMYCEMMEACLIIRELHDFSREPIKHSDVEIYNEACKRAIRWLENKEDKVEEQTEGNLADRKNYDRGNKSENN